MNNLLLTGTINPSYFNNTNVILTDVSKRLIQYENAIAYYIKESFFDKIIFVENSLHKFNFKRYENLAKTYNKKFEYLPITIDKENTILLGKSYGEASCIEEGIKQSTLLKNEQSFFKVTGRVIVKNCNLFKYYNDDKSRFLFRNDLKKCYTVFFKANIEEYKKYFFAAKKFCNEKEHKDIETVFYDIVSENQLKIDTFDIIHSYTVLSEQQETVTMI